MIITIIISSVFLNIVMATILYSLTKETKKEKVIYKDKIVYKDKVVEKIVYKENPVRHQFVKKEEPKVSKEKQDLLDALTELKAKKKKSKKDNDNIYMIEKILPNIK